MTEKDKSKVGNQIKNMPRDAHVVMSILQEAGIKEYEPRVVTQLLEFMHNYVTAVLEDARVFATHAKKKIIDVEDIKLACQVQVEKSFTSPPSRDVLMELARAKNVTPLPLIKPHCGLRLPPDRYCLSACNYRLKSGTKKIMPKATTSAPTTVKTATTTKPAPPNMVMKRPIVNIAGSKPIPKPVLKFSSTSKIVAKPAVRVTAGPSPQVKIDVDDLTTLKRKREEDDYDL